MVEQEQIITDDSDLRKWRTELPNLIDDLGLNPYERTLYTHYKRRCGANGGECYESVRTTSDKTKMSLAKVVESRRSLEKRGLVTTIAGTPHRKDAKGATTKVYIVDIWRLNFVYYSIDNRPNVDGWTIEQLKQWVDGILNGERSPHERNVRHTNDTPSIERSPGEQKKEPILLMNEHEELGANAPPFLPDQFKLPIKEIMARKFTREQWEAIETAEEARGDDARSTLLRQIDQKLRGCQHPAIVVYREVYDRYPKKTQFEAIIEAVGSNGNLEFWREVVQAWNLAGYNPYNVGGMLECFKSKRPPDPRRNNGGKNAPFGRTENGRNSTPKPQLSPEQQRGEAESIARFEQWQAADPEERAHLNAIWAAEYEREEQERENV